MKKEFLLITFSSTHTAMAMEKLLEKRFNIMVMPVLREISSSCGIAIKMETIDLESLAQVIDENKFEKQSYKIYKILEHNGNREVIEVK